MATFRGLTKQQEQKPSQLIRDTRTMSQRIQDFFQDSRNAAIVLVIAGISLFVPGMAIFSDIIFFVAIGLFIYCYTRKSSLPFRLPKRAKMKDYNDLKAGGTQPHMARGICFYGNDINTGEELWFNNDDMRTHTLIFGSTGSGKTEALVSLAYNALLQGSGFIYVDGKGDSTLFAKIFSMTRSLGREDDLLLINFMTGARDIIGKQKHRLSNTLNPFSHGSSSMLSQLIVGLMSAASDTPDGDMWKGRAISFVEALMKLLVYMRDQGKILLDANTIRNYFILERLEQIVIDKVFPRDNQESVNIADLPETATEPLYNYVINLPGFNKEKKGKQVSQVFEQHGFITMQLTRVFTSLADTYGHILRTNLAEVDFKDVVLNRRILVVLLPALEKAPEELANLGKIIVSSLKAMMAAGLGEEIEGDYRDVIVSKPTNSPTPYMCILDEYGYYAVPGFAVVPAQARSLGFSVIFAGQDLPAFQKASKEEAASIGANTNIKIAMKLEDPIETWEFFSKTAAESYVTKVDSFQTNASSMSNSYLDARSASAEKRARIDLLDLKEQREGEMHIFFKSTIVRARAFFANPQPVPYIQLNQFLKVDKPPTRQLANFKERIEKIQAIINQDSFDFGEPEYNHDLDTVITTFQHADATENLIDVGKQALNAVFAAEEEEDEQEKQEEEEKLLLESMEEESEEDESEETFEEERPESMNVFMPAHLLPVSKEILSESKIDEEEFSQPLISKDFYAQKLEFIERLNGKSKKQAKGIAKEIVNDMNSATNYPPHVFETPDIEKIVQSTKELAEAIRKQ